MVEILEKKKLLLFYWVYDVLILEKLESFKEFLLIFNMKLLFVGGLRFLVFNGIFVKVKDMF